MRILDRSGAARSRAGRSRRATVALGALAIVWAVLVGFALPVRAEPAATLGTLGQYEEVLAAVRLNGVLVTDSTLVIRDAAGIYYAGTDDVKAWNLVKNGRRSVDYNGGSYWSLSDFKVTFDANKGELALSAPPSVFGLNIVDFQDGAEHQAEARPKLERGGFLNYDFADHAGTEGSGISGSFNGAFTALDGVVAAGFVQPGDKSGFVRLNTTFELDDLPARTVLKFGDATQAGGVSPLERQFGGIQWGTDFALEPSFTTVALPVFAGALASDGTLDVIVNGREISQRQIPAGPFVLQNLPVAAGSGNVTLVLRDAGGQVQSIASPYYQSPILLRPGVSQFEFDAGSARQGYGYLSNAYDGTFVAAQGRRGIDNRLTLGVALDGTDRAQTGSLAAAYLLPPIGQISAAISDRAGLDPGVQQTYTYSYQGRRFSLGGQFLASSPQYRNDGCQLPCTAARYQLVGSASVPAGRAAAVSVSYGHSITSDGNSSLTTGLSYTRPLWRGQLGLSIAHSASPPASTTVNATFGMQIGARGYASVSGVQAAGQSGQTFSYNESMSDGPTGVAYGLQAQSSQGGGRTYNFNATEQLADVMLSQQMFSSSGTLYVSTDVAGSLAFVDGKISPSRTIGQGFAVVELPGYPGVGVFSNGQEVGRTDASGRLILPQLQPYQSNQITLAAEDLPIGVDLVTSSLAVAPYGLSPGIARFVVKSSGGVSVTIVDASGTDLPAGTKIVAEDGKQVWRVAFDGFAYLDGVPAGKQRFAARTSAAACWFDLVIPKNLAKLPDLGRAVCR